MKKFKNTESAQLWAAVYLQRICGISAVFVQFICR